MKDPFTKEEYEQMLNNPKGGLEKWLPRDWLEDKIAGRPHKYPDWYLALGESLKMLRHVTDSLMEQAKEKGLLK